MQEREFIVGLAVLLVTVIIALWWFCRRTEHLEDQKKVVVQSRRFALRYARPFGLGFSPDGKTLYATGVGTLAAYTVDVGAKLKLTLKKKRQTVGSMMGLAVSPDGTRLAVAKKTAVAIYDAATLKFLGGVKTEKGATTVELAFSHDGALVAASDEFKQRVGVYDVSKITSKDATALVGHIPAGLRPVGVQCAKGPKGEPLVAFTSQQETRGKKCTGSVRIADLTTLSVLRTISVGCDPVRLTGFTGTGTVYVTSRADNKVLVVDVGTGKAVKEIQVGTAPVGIGVHKNVAVVACSNRFNNGNGTIDIVDLDAGKVVSSLPALKFPRTVAMSPTGAVAAVIQYGSNAIDLVTIPILK